MRVLVVCRLPALLRGEDADVVGDKPVHRRLAVHRHVAAEDLQIDGGEVMVGIGVEFALKLRLRLHERPRAGGIRVPLVACEAFNP